MTVTHPDIARYFMTIPEAVGLVLQAAVRGRGGETFVVDMGEPVRIADVARDLIELSGLEIGRDVDIVCTGLRPREKMFEELFASVKRHERTEHEKVFVAQNGNEGPTIRSNCITRLVAAAQEGSQDDVERILCELLPTCRRRRGVSPAPRMESGGRSVAPGVGQAISRS